MKKTAAISFFILLAIAGLTPQLEAGDAELLKEGQKFAALSQYEEAARCYKQALDDSPSASAAYNLGVIYHHELNFKAKAVLYYQRFLDLAPADPESGYVRQWLRQCQSEIDPQAFPPEASPTPQATGAVALIQAGTGESSYISSANQHLARGDYNRAIAAYRQALMLDRSPVACYNLAVLYDYDLHYPGRAVYYYERYLGMAPGSAQTAALVSRVKELKEQMEMRKNNLGIAKSYKLRD